MQGLQETDARNGKPEAEAVIDAQSCMNLKGRTK
jgi:hypothetical protein